MEPIVAWRKISTEKLMESSLFTVSCYTLFFLYINSQCYADRYTHTKWNKIKKFLSNTKKKDGIISVEQGFSSRCFSPLQVGSYCVSFLNMTSAQHHFKIDRHPGHSMSMKSSDVCVVSPVHAVLCNTAPTTRKYTSHISYSSSFPLSFPSNPII